MIKISTVMPVDAHPALLDEEDMAYRMCTCLTMHFRMGLLKQMDK